MVERPKVGVGILVRKEDKFLLLKRKNAHGEGSWCFPGGHLEFNEEINDCAMREVEEETGIKIKNPQFLGITNDMFKNEGKHYITIFVISDHEEGEGRIMEPEKCTDIGWFDINNLPSPLFLPINNLLNQKDNIIEEIKNLLNKDQ